MYDSADVRKYSIKAIDLKHRTRNILDIDCISYKNLEIWPTLGGFYTLYAGLLDL